MIRRGDSNKPGNPVGIGRAGAEITRDGRGATGVVVMEGFPIIGCDAGVGLA